MAPIPRIVCAAGIAATLLASLFCRPAVAQAGTISGTVTDSTGTDIAGADIRVEGTFLHAASDERGHYELVGVPPGTHTLRVLLLGYRAATQSVTLSAGASAEINFTLERTPIPMPAVEVVVGSRARHTAADELAVPVDVYQAEEIA